MKKILLLSVVLGAFAVAVQAGEGCCEKQAASACPKTRVAAEKSDCAKTQVAGEASCARTQVAGEAACAKTKVAGEASCTKTKVAGEGACSKTKVAGEACTKTPVSAEAGACSKTKVSGEAKGCCPSQAGVKDNRQALLSPKGAEAVR